MGPPIAPPSDPDAARPFCSVMIPAYEPGVRHLEAALRSVLDQGQGSDLMQIAVVDDASPTVDVAGLVRKFCGDRVEYHRNPSNLRLAGNWNRAIELARGRWVHLLHQDDLVRPGFHEALGRAAPEAGMFCCQNAFINAEGRWASISRLIRPEPGLLEGWLEAICREQLIQCAAVAVRRDVYERLGGFRPDLLYVIDWEMWVRIAAVGVPCWYEPEILACYRGHSGSETARLGRDGRDFEDVRRGIEIVRGYLPKHLGRGAGAGILRFMGSAMMRRASMAIEGGSMRLGLRLLHEACRLDPSLRLDTRRFLYYRWILAATLRGRTKSSAQRPADVDDPIGVDR